MRHSTPHLKSWGSEESGLSPAGYQALKCILLLTSVGLLIDEGVASFLADLKPRVLSILQDKGRAAHKIYFKNKQENSPPPPSSWTVLYKDNHGRDL